MRLVFFILLLANAAALAYFLLEPRGMGTAARPPLRPEAIRVARTAGPPEGTPEGRCLEWVGLAGDDLSRARAALEALGLGDRIVLPGTRDHWVHIPPLNSREEAEKKLAELKGLGINEAAIVEDGQWRHAISLAAFPSAGDAESHLRGLQEKGVKSARVVERVREPASITLIRLDGAARQKVEHVQAEFGKGGLRSVACRLP